MDRTTPPPYSAQPQPYGFNLTVQPPPLPPPPPPTIVINANTLPPHPPPPQPTIIHVSEPIYTGNCPNCHRGDLESYYPWYGTVLCIVLTVLFFPLALIGIICCLYMRKKQCNHCGYSP